MQKPQPLDAVQRLRRHAQALEVVENVGLDAIQPGPGRFQALGLHAKGQVLGLDQAVVALGQLVFQKVRILFADAVELVAPQGDGNAVGVGVLGSCHVDKGQLETDGGVKIVEKIAPTVKDGGLVLVLAQLIVDVLKLDRPRVVAVRHPAGAVRVHPLERNAVLGGPLLLILLLCPGDGCFDLFSLCPGEFSLG